MKQFYNGLFSSRLMAIILILFAISIGVATFVENDFGAQTARVLIYNSLWFNILLFLGIVNLSGTIIVKQLYRKEKLTIFIFHIAFVFILIGAAITRFIGFEGMMHIREGQSSNVITSSNAFLQVTAQKGDLISHTEKQVLFSTLSNNRHSLGLRLENNKIEVECVEYIPNAIETIQDDPEGQPLLEIVVANEEGRQTIILGEYQTRNAGNIFISYNDTSNHNGINIILKNNEFQIISSQEFSSMQMSTQAVEKLLPNSFYPLQFRTLYTQKNTKFVVRSYTPKGQIAAVEVKDAKQGEYPSALRLKVSTNNQQKTIVYFANPGYVNPPVNVTLNNIVVSVAFGAKTIELPFALHLNRFILKHYPGSDSPSWFESSITLNDERNNLSESRRIYMNNVLKYNGYRFYQSSYDTDGKGTILSVNHDFWGTFITYFGYLLLAIGIILSLFNKNSRFLKLSAELTKIRELRKLTTIIGLGLFLTIVTTFRLSAESTIPDSLLINKQHAAQFGKILIQDPGGRIKPVNTLSSELLRKICRSDEFKGQNSDQVLLGMLVYPEFWQHIPMVKVSHPDILNILQLKNTYAAYIDFFDISTAQPKYKLGQYVTDAYTKKPATRNKFDTELIKIDERVNLSYMIYSQEFLRIFPRMNDSTKTWYSPANADTSFSGNDSLVANSFVPFYFQTIRDANLSGEWKLPNDALQALERFQIKNGSDLIPDSKKTKLEILYNRINIFDRLGAIYGLVGFVLLLLQFISIFKPAIKLKIAIGSATVIIVVAFLLHIAGLAARWYISGHAPWSNAYESLIYIAFATVLAGILFSRKSAITLSVTALIAWLILFVAHLNWLDPEITNLVPVLKSYWLVIHVAIITASYGFLALGALLAVINFVLMIMQTAKNRQTVEMIISQLTIIIEMNLIIGLYMLTVGTFLGGVWANESWGRYWGWDPKETWALVSILVYAFVAHMRMVPGLKSKYLFNLMALLSFSSIIMTYFGVNYYLSGLHSYAKGDPVPLPPFVYYALIVVFVLSLVAWINQRRIEKEIYLLKNIEDAKQ